MRAVLLREDDDARVLRENPPAELVARAIGERYVHGDGLHVDGGNRGDREGVHHRAVAVRGVDVEIKAVDLEAEVAVHADDGAAQLDLLGGVLRVGTDEQLRRCVVGGACGDQLETLDLLGARHHELDRSDLVAGDVYVRAGVRVIGIVVVDCFLLGALPAGPGQLDVRAHRY